MSLLDWLLRRRTHAQSGKPEWRGVIVHCEPCEQTSWNIRVVANCVVEGLHTAYPAIKDCDGRVQVRVGDSIRIEQLIGGEFRPASVSDLRPGRKVEIGFFSFTEQANPVAIYPNSLLLLS